jgi:uncharacterized membrane protein YdbT with pleckstrin-like domain
VISNDARIDLLRKIHLFHDLSDDEIQVIAQRCVEAFYDTGEIIFEQGSKAESFFIIYKGKVRLVRRRDGKEEQLTMLVDNDYFGELALISNRSRSATATAMLPTTLLVLSRRDFDELLRKNPKLKPNLDMTIHSRLLARKLQFKWLRPDEVVYFLARKHPILLYEAMVLPALVLLVPIGGAFWSLLTGAVTPLVLGGLIFLADLGWAVWRAIDWSNDYYVVTNQRVVWLEKVIGLYDSRQEAPLSGILSVGVETEMVGRLLDYGNVIVRTFVGRIPFSDVTHPHQAARMIEEYWQRTKVVSQSAEKEAMKDAIRQKLGLTVAAKPVETTQASPAEEPVVRRPKAALSLRDVLVKIMASNTLKFRYEVGETVIYHKHWIVLLQQTWLPAAFLVGLFGLWVGRIFTVASSPELVFFHMTEAGLSVDTFFMALPIMMVPFLLWLLYQISDWSNDTFQVTEDQIIDIDRKPFGTEERRAAPLENILSTEYERLGLIGNLFNYGTVHITVGGAKLAFEDVFDPATVQSDIDRRRIARLAKTNASKVKVERERVAEWLAAYHENADEFGGSTSSPPRAAHGPSDNEHKNE